MQGKIYSILALMLSMQTWTYYSTLLFRIQHSIFVCKRAGWKITHSSVQLYCNSVIDAVLLQGSLTWLHKFEQEIDSLLCVAFAILMHRKLWNLEWALSSFLISKNHWWPNDSMYQFVSVIAKLKWIIHSKWIKSCVFSGWAQLVAFKAWQSYHWDISY